GVRVDAGVEAGDIVSSHYDPMIAKVIAHGPTRDAAAARLASALEHTTLLGLKANAPFLVSLLHDETFLKGDADTGYVERALDEINARTEETPTAEDVALVAAALTETAGGALLGGWNSRGTAPVPLKLQCGETVIEARATWTPGAVVAEHAGARVEARLIERGHSDIRYRVGDRVATARYARDGDVVDIQRGAVARRFVDLARQPASEGGAAADVVKAPMAGVVTTLSVKPGQKVAKGETVATIEAMKMEHKLTAPRDGVVEDVRAEVGAQVAIRATIVSLVKD
ncbi:MAG: biotin/lipoyl-binding protein, partial [Parvularculaceae bacterium]|nr:biotin/lipoyl-binding protein [Parvularculaceae bacterium]